MQSYNLSARDIIHEQRSMSDSELETLTAITDVGQNFLSARTNLTDSEPSSVCFSSKEDKSVKIFCFTWNSESIRIAEAVRHSGEEPLSILSEYWYKCEQPDFLPELLQKVFCKGEEAENNEEKQCKYDLLVFSLQESAKPGDYLLNAIANELGNRYTLLRRQRMLGVGKTSWTSLARDWQIKLRGVRIAVFARKEFEERIALLGDAFVPCPGRERLTHGKGAVAVVLRVVDIGIIAFINVHLPFDSKTLDGSNQARIQSGVAFQNKALNSVIEYVRDQYRGIHYVFLMGDLNYRVLHRENQVDARAMYHLLNQGPEQRRIIYETRDELKQSINYGALPPFLEGIENKGPDFMPSAKMTRDRSPSGNTSIEAYKLGTNFQRNPSWTDRIIYASHRELEQTERPQRLRAEYGRIIEGDGDILCTLYDRFEQGKTMTKSDHSSVIGAFEIKPFLGGEDSGNK